MDTTMNDIIKGIPGMALPPKTHMIRVICSYCNKDLGIKDGGFKAGLVSHGICKECMVKELEKIHGV